MKLVILSAITNCINVIWYCRNQRRFTNRSIQYISAINLIIEETAMAGNNSKLHAYSSNEDFIILKAFSVQHKYGNAPVIKEIIWQPPIFHWKSWSLFLWRGV